MEQLFYGADFEKIIETSKLNEKEIGKVNNLLEKGVDNIVFYLKEKLNNILENEEKNNFVAMFNIFSKKSNLEKEKLEKALENFKKGEIGDSLSDRTNFLEEVYNLVGLKFNRNKYFDLEGLHLLLEGRNRVSGKRVDGTFGLIPEVADGVAGIGYANFYKKYKNEI